MPKDRRTEESRLTDKGWKEGGRCVGSDPYWPHQALAGRCTPRSGQRSRIAAGRHPRSAACRAFPQTASCLLNRKRARGRKVGGWKRGENRQMLADGTVLMKEHPPTPRHRHHHPSHLYLLWWAYCCCCCYCCVSAFSAPFEPAIPTIDRDRGLQWFSGKGRKRWGYLRM